MKRPVSISPWSRGSANSHVPRRRSFFTASFAPGSLGGPFTAPAHPLTFSIPSYLADALLFQGKGTQ